MRCSDSATLGTLGRARGWEDHIEYGLLIIVLIVVVVIVAVVVSWPADRSTAAHGPA